jgi:hypothetical protein
MIANCSGILGVFFLPSLPLGSLQEATIPVAAIGEVTMHD